MPEPTTQADSQPMDPPKVEVLRWPEQDDRRRLLALLAEPRLLVVAADTPPPPALDDLEIWVRHDSYAGTIVDGVTALQRKARQPEQSPVLDDDGLLWFRGRWTDITDGQIGVVDLLVNNYRRLVRNDDLSRAYEHDGGSNTPASVRALVHRITRRLAQVGLQLHVVRRRGVILVPTDTDT